MAPSGPLRGTLAQPTFSDIVIGEPCEPTRAIYYEHMDFPIVRLRANMAAGLSSPNWVGSQLTLLDNNGPDFIHY